MILFTLLQTNSITQEALTTKDIFQVGSWIAAIIAGIVTAYMSIKNYSQSLEIRKSELRWRQASVAREILKDIHQHEKAKVAILMMDWNVCYHIHPYEEKEFEFSVSYEEVLKVLPHALEYDTSNSPRNYEKGDRDYYILDCFDWFFYYVDRLQQNINSDLILFENVEYVFKPYHQKILKNKEVFDKFMSDRGYELAPKFWKNYNKKKQKKVSAWNKFLTLLKLR